MVSVNRVMLRGLVGSDQFVRRFKCKNGSEKVSFSLRTGDGNNSSWHNVVYFTPEGESFDIKQGDELAVDGRIVHEGYTDKENNKKTKTSIIATMCEKRLTSDDKAKSLMEEAQEMFSSAKFSNEVKNDSIEF